MKSPFPKETYQKNAHVYRILANPKRLEILNILKRRESSVEEIIKLLNVPKANVSQHLSLLRHSGLIVPRRHGLNVYYKIIDPRIVEPCRILHNLRHRSVVA